MLCMIAMGLVGLSLLTTAVVMACLVAASEADDEMDRL